MSKHRYSLSFTAASFRLNDFKLQSLYADTPGRINREDVDADKVLGAGMQKTNQRIVTELVKRYNALTPVQRELMIEVILMRKSSCAIWHSQVQSFIREFIVEIVRKKRYFTIYSQEARISVYC